jgi:hypothetical protein
LFLGAQLKIYNPQNPIIEIYATTIHELAYASHWNMSRSDFDNSESIVKESWAVGVQWELTRINYPSYRGRSWNTTQPNYTPVVIDMIDNFREDNGGSENLEIDNVDGYSIRQVEDALLGQKTWND